MLLYCIRCMDNAAFSCGLTYSLPNTESALLMPLIWMDSGLSTVAFKALSAISTARFSGRSENSSKMHCRTGNLFSR